jgi:hypothetical protein
MKTKKTKPYVPSNRAAMAPPDAQVEADRAQVEAWKREHAVKKLPAAPADYSTDVSRLFGRSTTISPTYRG